MKVPDYAKVKCLNEAGSSAKPILKSTNCFFLLDVTLDHSSQGSVNAWKDGMGGVTSIFNNSPLAKQLQWKFSVRDFLAALKGMKGDHANNEKATAKVITGWKKEECIQELGKKNMQGKAPADVILCLAAWNEKKLEEVGGIEAWNQLSPTEQAKKDSEIMRCIVTELGEEEYDCLCSEE